MFWSKTQGEPLSPLAVRDSSAQAEAVERSPCDRVAEVQVAGPMTWARLSGDTATIGQSLAGLLPSGSV